MSGTIGVLGGMGPLATVDFMRKVIDLTPARRDQEHLPLIVYSVPQVPGRSACILEGAASPLPAMVHGIRTLAQAGAECIAIPCNTAHHWYDELARESPCPVLHIVDAACAAMERRAVGQGAVGLLATAGTIAAGVYQERLDRHGYDCVVLGARDMEDLVMRGIALVKAGEMEDARALLETAAAKLGTQGVRAIVLGCTEIPIVFNGVSSSSLPPVVDATQALAEACVEWYFGRAGLAAESHG